MTIRATILAAMPATRSALAATLNLPTSTVRYHTERLQAENLCHVGAWDEAHGGPWVPVLHAGPGPDAPYPAERATKPRAQVQADWVDKARATGSWDKVLEQRRARYRKKQQQQQLWLAPLTTEPRPYY